MGESDVSKIRKGFRSGYEQLRRCDARCAKMDLATAIGCSIRSVDAFKLGRIEPKITQAIAIEKVFEKYGVISNIWGD